MSTILTATLLGVPAVIVFGYLLLHYPRQTAIIAGETALYAVPLVGHVALTRILAPFTEPAWVQIFPVVSVIILIFGIAPVCARRAVRRLRDAENAEQSQEQGDSPA